MDNIIIISPRDYDIVRATLDMLETDAYSQMLINLNASANDKDVDIYGVWEVLEDSTYYELIRGKIALTGSYVYDCIGLGDGVEVKFTHIDEVKGFVIHDLAKYQNECV